MELKNLPAYLLPLVCATPLYAAESTSKGASETPRIVVKDAKPEKTANREASETPRIVSKTTNRAISETPRIVLPNKIASATRKSTVGAAPRSDSAKATLVGPAALKLEVSQNGQSWTALNVKAQPLSPNTNPAAPPGATPPLSAGTVPTVPAKKALLFPAGTVPPVPVATAQAATPEQSAVARTGTSAAASAASDPAAAPAITTVAPTSPRASPFQISLDPSFGTDSERFPSEDGSVVISSTFQELPISLRYRASSNDTLTLRLPYVRRQNKVSVGNQSLLRTSSDGLGDVQIGYERAVTRLNQSPWNATFGAGLGLPTGKSIYGLGADETALGSGHYELSSFLDIGRVADPVILNAQVGLNYSVPRRVNGTLVSPGLGYSLSTGVGYAIDDRFVLSEQLSFSRRSNVFLITPVDTQFEKISQAYLTQSLIYTPVAAKRVYRLSFTLGLNNASTDYVLGLSVR